jgi:hypothetical protein
VNIHYIRLNVAEDGITLIEPHPSAPQSTTGYIVAKVCYGTCDSQPSEDSKKWAQIIAEAVNDWAARHAPVRLTCCCCGEYAGRWVQFSNRDTGFGICKPCIEKIRAHRPFGHEPMSEEEITRTYGTEGVNWGAQ